MVQSSNKKRSKIGSDVRVQVHQLGEWNTASKPTSYIPKYLPGVAPPTFIIPWILQVESMHCRHLRVHHMMESGNAAGKELHGGSKVLQPLLVLLFLRKFFSLAKGIGHSQKHGDGVLTNTPITAEVCGIEADIEHPHLVPN